MQTLTSEHESSTDLSAIAWVYDELRRSLDSAHKLLRRHVKETEAMLGADVDAVDPDLFPIFEEEAAELLPQLGGAVRQWTARPGKALRFVV